MSFHKYFTGKDWYKADRPGFKLDEYLFDNCVKDYYTKDVFYIIDRFFKQYINIGVNGPIRVPYADYDNFPAWIGSVHDYLYGLLLKYAKEKSVNP